MFTDVDYVRRYIPLGWLGFSVVYAGWGLSPVAYHAANLFLHVANTVLLFWVLVSVLRRWEAAGFSWSIACAACSARPLVAPSLRAESVGWISGILYGQAGFFALISVLAYLRAAARAQGTPRRPNLARGDLGPGLSSVRSAEIITEREMKDHERGRLDSWAVDATRRCRAASIPTGVLFLVADNCAACRLYA